MQERGLSKQYGLGSAGSSSSSVMTNRVGMYASWESAFVGITSVYVYMSRFRAAMFPSGLHGDENNCLLFPYYTSHHFSSWGVPALVVVVLFFRHTQNKIEAATASPITRLFYVICTHVVN